MEVRNYQNEKLGKVDDLAIDVESGRIVQAILGCTEFGLWQRYSSVTAPRLGDAPRHRPNWAQRTSSHLCLRPLRNQKRDFAQ